MCLPVGLSARTAQSAHQKYVRANALNPSPSSLKPQILKLHPTHLFLASIVGICTVLSCNTPLMPTASRSGPIWPLAQRSTHPACLKLDEQGLLRLPSRPDLDRSLSLKSRRQAHRLFSNSLPSLGLPGAEQWRRCSHCSCHCPRWHSSLARSNLLTSMAKSLACGEWSNSLASPA
jgi:hypothetical protein